MLKGKIKIFIFSIVSVFLFGLVLSPAYASPKATRWGLTDTARKAELEGAIAGATDVPSLVGKVISAVLGLMGIVFFFIIFYSGFRWMTARGNSDVIEKSKDAILSAAIGLVIILAAYAITNFVFQELTVTSL